MALVPAAPDLPTHVDYLRRSYLPELDGIRALSIAGVIAHHMGDHSWEWVAGPLGVTVFFVLSGYLITRLALREERELGSLNIPAFFVRRVFRLFPVYYVVLILYCILVFKLHLTPGKVEMFVAGMPYYLSYFQEYVLFELNFSRHYLVPFAHTWSLGIEEKFYLVWPFLGFVAWRAGGTTRVAATAVLAALAWMAPWLLGHKVGVFFFPYSEIALGCLVALVFDRASWFDGLSWLRRRWVGLLGLGAFLAIQFAIPHVESRSMPLWYGPYMLAYTFATALLLMAILLGNPIFLRLLRWPPLVMVGRLSYGMYLIHALVIRVVEKVIPPVAGNLPRSVLSLALVIGLSIGTAHFLALMIERPGIALGKRLSGLLHRKKERGKSAKVSDKPVEAVCGSPPTGDPRLRGPSIEVQSSIAGSSPNVDKYEH